MTRLIAVLGLAVLTAGCTLEIRNGTEVWACGDVPGTNQVFTGCQDTGVRVFLH